MLSQADITDWNLVINDGSSTFNLLGPLSGANSGDILVGPDLTATASGLFWDFSDTNPGGLDFQNPGPGSGINFACFNNGTSLCSGVASSIGVATTGAQVNGFYEGVVQIATAAVPEPATWALMLVGFGGVGLAMRSRRKAVTAPA